MNSSAKNLLLEKARSLLLDAVGCMSCPIAPQLSEKLEKAGPVPFAPAEIEKRLAPEEILADTKSIAVISLPLPVPRGKECKYRPLCTSQRLSPRCPRVSCKNYRIYGRAVSQ